MKQRKPRRRYDDQFKDHAVKLVLSTGKPVQTIAHELGISHTCLQNWKADHLQRNESAEDRLTAAHMEIDRLKRLPPSEIAYCDQCGRILVRS